ncbi:MAG TPA: hypothetical protein VIH90_08360 [Candidatus Saccharimonadales bacterium]
MVERSHGKVFFVDDDEVLQRAFPRQARLAGIKAEDIEAFGDAKSVVDRLERATELDEVVSVIFSDGLNGDWRQVIDAAREARIPAVVLSADRSIQPEAKEAGVAFIDKRSLEPGELGTLLAQFVIIPIE